MGWNIALTPQPPNSPDLNVIDLSFFVLSHRPCQWDFLMKLWFIWICWVRLLLQTRLIVWKKYCYVIAKTNTRFSQVNNKNFLKSNDAVWHNIASTDMVNVICTPAAVVVLEAQDLPIDCISIFVLLHIRLEGIFTLVVYRICSLPTFLLNPYLLKY